MYLRLRLDAVVFNPLLLGCFAHCSRRFTIVDDLCFTMTTVNVDSPLCCSSGLSIAFNVIGVSSWFFLCLLFHHFWFRFAGVAPPSRRVRHGRCRVHFVPQSMQLRTLVDAQSRGEHVSAIAFAVGLTGGEFSSVSAVAVAVKARGWG